MKRERDIVDYSRPVAYDTDGRPLYARRPGEVNITAEQSEQDDGSPEAGVETNIRHNTSKRYFPMVTLHKDEYIIASVHRHPIGLFLPFLLGTVLLSMLLSVVFNYDLFLQVYAIEGPLTDHVLGSLVLLLAAALVAIGTYISYYVYSNNRFFITNKSVIQHLQVGLFSRKEQIVSLENIEDASYHQRSILQQFFNYGSIKLTIEGYNDQVYRYTYVSNPREYLEVLNNAIDESDKH